MKLIHWAVIFTIIIIPFSLICRNNINNRFMALKDEVRINNAVDTATYDATDFLAEWATVVGGSSGKNLNITEETLYAVANQFFTTMAVNMNLPYSDLDSAVTKNAKAEVENYIPAIILVGYDGFYIYSAELVGDEIKYVFKPKIPYTYEEGNMIINFTLDNYVTIYNKSPIVSENIRIYEGYLYDAGTYDPTEYDGYTREQLVNATTNLSLIIDKLDIYTFPSFLKDAEVTKDYEFDEKGNMIEEAGEFHKKRRETIVNLITQALNEEMNEHNRYATMLGIEYYFSIPEISKDQWINSVDDVSVLAFVQGIPIGIDEHYNNFALGGTRIVRAKDIYGGKDGNYHRETCTYIDYKNIGDVNIEEFLLSKEEGAKKGYTWCPICKP